MKNQSFILLNALINQLTVYLPIVPLYSETKNTFLDSLSRYSCKHCRFVYLKNLYSLKKNDFVYKQRLYFIPSSDNSLKSSHISYKSWTNSYKSSPISYKSCDISLKSWLNSCKSRGNSCKQNRRLIPKKRLFQHVFPEAHSYQPFFILNNRLHNNILNLFESHLSEILTQITPIEWKHLK